MPHSAASLSGSTLHKDTQIVSAAVSLPSDGVNNDWAAREKLLQVNPAVKADIFKAYSGKMETVRLLAITSIVWGHALFGWENVVFINPSNQVLQSVLMQLGRIGTVSFFIISGFFFNRKLQTFSVVSYLRYRFYSLILPWLSFLCFFVFVQLLQILKIGGLFSNNPIDTVKLSINLFSAGIFHAAFWFIPVSIFSACLLIVFKKHVHRLWFGILLVVITLFYCVNLYYAWVSVNHARSFLGYVLFMWLGVQLNQHLDKTEGFVNKLPRLSLLLASVLAFALACREGWVLKSMGCLDSFGSIRFSNIVLSILVFIMLLKTNKLNWVQSLKPQSYIYGVYLVHSILLLFLMPHLSKFVLQHHLFLHLSTAVLFQLVVFAVVITASYGLVYFIKKSRLGFIIGGR